MTNSKLFEKLADLLAKPDDGDKKHLKKLRKVLHKLKSNQKKMEARLEEELSAEERRKLEQDIAVLKLQRKKGAAVYKRLKKGREGAPPEA